MHPGPYIREHVLKPRKLSVTKAAALIGMSRPNLSNFLNGKIKTTPEMAARLERSFGVSAKEILDMQTEYDRKTTDTSQAIEKARSYVPAFLDFKANDIIHWIEKWANEEIIARSRLSVFLRRLILSTNEDILAIDFPGNDNSQRPGKDGELQTSAGTPWVPVGHSIWEFGVNQDIKSKANHDYVKSVRKIPLSERQNATFIFVTPRTWKNKTDWVKQKLKAKQWSGIRAYDASDLEQWMEQSIAAQAWFANETNKPSHGVRTLDFCWENWASKQDRPLFRSLFATMKTPTTNEKIQSFLSQQAPSSLYIAAESAEEALGFLSQFLDSSELEKYRSRVLVFDEPGVLPTLAQGTRDFIAVVHTQEVEQELIPYRDSLKSIHLYPRNTTHQIDITLEPLRYNVFSSVLQKHNFSNNKIQSLADQSGRSLTVLRRLLNHTQASWSQNLDLATMLIPFALLGTWNRRDKAEMELLCQLANLPREKLEKNFLILLSQQDSPVWVRDQYKGVISKLDALNGVASMITESELERFIAVARKVLSEDDPAFELTVEERWLASPEKRRLYSDRVRESIADTLTLLAIHGEQLFKHRIDFDAESEVLKLIQDLLLPLTTKKLIENQNELPYYAEIAPEKFLDIVQKDLLTEHSQVIGLLQPIGTPLFGSCPRSGLLHALEALAWNPSTFRKVILILGKLSTQELQDNWGNEPINSLKSIFCSWMPQTAADLEKRIESIKELFEKYPQVGWNVCLHLISENSNSNSYSYKPKWRSDADNFGEPLITLYPHQQMVEEVINLILNLDPQAYTADRLGDLIDQLHRLSTDKQDRVWEKVDTWRQNGAKDEDIARLREKIRVSILSERYRNQSEQLERAYLTPKGKMVYEKLQPKDPLNQYAWLFRDEWVEFSADEKQEDPGDLDGHIQRIDRLRRDALKDIMNDRGLEGILELSKFGKCHCSIGRILACDILDEMLMLELFLIFNAQDEMDTDDDKLVASILCNLEDPQKNYIYAILLLITSTEKELLHFLQLFPYRADTWKLVDKLSQGAQQEYWRTVVPKYIKDDPDENWESIHRLLEAKRPRAAFATICLHLHDIDPSLQMKILTSMRSKHKCNDESGKYLPEKQDLTESIHFINSSLDIPLKEKAALEFMYIDVLGSFLPKKDKQQIPSLERYIESNPEFFVQIIAWTFKRQNNTERSEDISEVTDQDILADRGHRLLQILSHIPGEDKPQEEEQKKELEEWISTVRLSSSALGLKDITDRYLGRLFSHAPLGKDGVWPSEAVRDIMEAIHSDGMKLGTRIGLYNARGAFWRKNGGDQERELADKYRFWAESLEFTHPFVASVLKWLVDTYDSEATQQDIDAAIERRMVG